MRFYLLTLASVCLCLAEEYQLEYYTELTLTCDETDYNFTQTNPVNKYWLLPDGNFTMETGHLDKRIIIGTDMSNFTLTLKRLDDPDFGWYYCIIVWDNHSLDRIRHGVNIDGPYYGNLLDKYRHNAMIGGIAAAILFVILAGTCIIWHCRYRNDNTKNSAVDDLDKAIQGYDIKSYDNEASDTDDVHKEYFNNLTVQDDKL